MTDEALCEAVRDWNMVRQMWRRSREAGATQAVHEALDEFLQPMQKPEPPTELDLLS
jgi:hypothetical protein